MEFLRLLLVLTYWDFKALFYNDFPAFNSSTPNSGQEQCWEKCGGSQEGASRQGRCGFPVLPQKGRRNCWGRALPASCLETCELLPTTPSSFAYPPPPTGTVSLSGGLRAGPAPIQPIQQDRKPSALLPACL